MHRSLRLGAAAAVMVVMAGCKVDVRVGIEADEHGRGEVEAAVTLDSDAQRYVGDLRGQLVVDDLVKAGWRVDGPHKIAKGAQRVTATKSFDDPGDVPRIVNELDGDSGLFENFVVRQQRSFLKTTSRFGGQVDLRRGIDAFSDATVRDELGESFGASPEELSRRIGSTLADAIPITVGVRLPGSVSSNAPQSSGGAAAWHPRIGEDVRLAASATHWNVRGIGFAAVSLVAGTLGVLSALRLRRRRARSGHPDHRGVRG